MKLYVVQDVKSKAFLAQSGLYAIFTSDKSRARRFGLADAQRALEFYTSCQIVPVSEISPENLGNVR